MSKNNRKYRDEKHEREAEIKAERLGLVGDGAITVTTKLDVKPEPVIEEIKEREPEEKYYVEEPYLYYGGATSFDDYEAYQAAREESWRVSDLTSVFRSIVDNILVSDDIEQDAKSSAITAASEEFQARLSQRKGLVEKVSDFFRSKFAKKQEPSHMGLTVFKDANDEWRWLGIFTNNFKDREGDIITAEAHKEFCAYLDANPEMAPSFRAWHIPGSDRKSKADLWAYDERGFFLIGGKLLEDEACGLKKAFENYDNIGMSHGFYCLRDKENPRIITKYRSFEVSDLPLEKAANPWTEVAIILKELEMKVNDEKLDYLKTVLGESRVAEINANMDKAATELAALEIESKENEQPVDEQPVDEVKETEPKSAALDQVVELVTKAVIDTFKPQELSETLKAIMERLTNVEATQQEQQKSIEEKVAEELAPRSMGFMWERPSQSKETELDPENADDKKLKESLPNSENSWVGEAMSQS